MVRDILLSAGALCLSAATCAAQPAPSYVNEAAIIEQLRTSIRFENDGTGRREQYFRIKVNSEAGVQQLGQLVFGYNAATETIDIAFVRVKKPDGTVVATPSAAVQDLSAPVQRIAPVYTDFRQKHVTVESLRPGDTLEADVVYTVHTALAPGEFWTEYNFNDNAIVLDEQFDLDVPAARPIILKTGAGFDPVVKEENGRKLYHWAHANTVRKDPSKTKTDARASEPKRAAIRVTSFADWAAVGRWFAGLEQQAREVTPEVRAKAQELTAGKTADLDKVEALYDFVSKNFRYVSLSLGAGRFQPRRAADVLRDEYGDCKDKHTLLAALITAIGLPVSPVLINAQSRIDPDFPSPSQFDHVITRVMVGGQEVWLDSTPEIAPFRMLSPVLRHKQALLAVTGDGSHLVETPSDTPMRGLSSIALDGALDASGRLSAKVAFSFRGDPELTMRAAFRALPEPQWKPLLRQILSRGGLAGEVSSIKPSNPQDTTGPFTITCQIDIDDFLALAGKRVDFVLPMSDRSNQDPAETNEPIRLGKGDARYSLKVSFPSGVTVTAPVGVDVTRDYAAYHAAYSASGSVLSATRTLSTDVSELPDARREDYLAFLHVVRADNAQRISLDATALAAPSTPSTADAKELNNRAYARLQADDYAAAASLFEQALKVDPKSTNAWTNLGISYIALNQPEKAVDALQKQIALNPYDEFAYDQLGRAYSQLHKYADAETAFKKQLEINPLDAATPSALGALYMNRGQFDQAAAQYERAAALNPKQSGPLVQLGKAYLNLHRTDDAMKAFDRAVAMSPTPLTWNDVAYEMALGGVQLDTAQRYAESAIAAETAAARNLDLERVDGPALGVIDSLAAYWDTLGWVYFAKGDMRQAEKYVAPAWQLAQAADVGDHLGQIYEKEGRRADAVRMFAEALGRPNPADNVREHLRAAAGSASAPDDLVTKYRDELQAAQTWHLDFKGASPTKLDVVLLVAPPAQIEGVRIVGADQAPAGLSDVLKKFHAVGMFPDDAPAKLLRVGTVSCREHDCTLTLTAAGDAKPIR